MASRFGRNKKRKLQEQIAQLTRELGDTQTQMQCVRTNHRALVKNVEAWDQQLRKTLGKDSRFRIFIEGRQQNSGVYSDGTFRVMHQPPIGLPQYPSYEDLSTAIQTYEHISMAVSFLTIKKDEFNKQIRFILHHGGWTAGYACDVDHIVENARNDPTYVTHLSNEIARGLADHLG